MRTNEKLLAWRLKHELTQRAAAALAKMSQPAWQSYESGRLKPKARAAENIEHATRGHIKRSEWTESEEERAVRQTRRAAHSVRKPSAPPPPRRTGTEG